MMLFTRALCLGAAFPEAGASLPSEDTGLATGVAELLEDAGAASSFNLNLDSVSNVFGLQGNCTGKNTHQAGELIVQ